MRERVRYRRTTLRQGNAENSTREYGRLGSSSGKQKWRFAFSCARHRCLQKQHQVALLCRASSLSFSESSEHDIHNILIFARWYAYGHCRHRQQRKPSVSLFPLTGDSGLPHGLVSQGAAPRDDPDLALLVDVAGHDSWGGNNETVAVDSGDRSGNRRGCCLSMHPTVVKGSKYR